MASLIRVLPIYIPTCVIAVILVLIGLDYPVERDKDVPIIKYSSFIKFYKVNPDIWNIFRTYDNEVELKTSKTRFRFNIFAYYLRFKPYKDKIERQKKKEERKERIRKRHLNNNYSYNTLIRVMSKEIDRLDSKSKREIAQAEELIAHIKK